MPLHSDDPLALTTFVTLHPDRLVREFDKGPRLDLAELFPGPVPYDTLQLAPGLEMHHHPGSAVAPNTIASGLAELCGYERLDIRGTVHFTGDSAEADTAPGMGGEALCGLFEALAEVCNTQEVRLWRQYRPDQTVLVRPTDYAQGDTLWFLGRPHRFMRLVDYPEDSRTAQLFPGVQYFQCDDGFEMGASAPAYPTRAGQAPPGYWQRTGNQLLPAD
ncbi:hypothetical protein AB0H07_46495 [Streptomyces sp. NPDC021354]|uniref:hypothetical protein n=1 Tax=Streptomyces sp. NPDC021354 TaxID=3154793 RepID=UPI0033F68F88